MSEQRAVTKATATGGTEPGDRRAARRAQLLDSTTELIRRDGPSVSMDQVAAECGVTKPIVYRHFGDRDGLVHALALRFTNDLGEQLFAVATQGALPPKELLTTTIDVYLGRIEREVNLYRFLCENKPAGGNPHHLISLVAEQIALALRGHLEAGGLSTVPAEAWAYALVGMVHTVGEWWLDERTMGRGELVDLLVALAWDGLAAIDVPIPAVAGPMEPAPSGPVVNVASGGQESTEGTDPGGRR